MSDFFCLPGALPRVVSLTFAHKGMPSGLIGKRLLFITDIHYGAWLGDRPIGRIVQLAMAQDPHIIVLGGDLAEGMKAQRRLMDRHLPGLTAPLGVFCVAGNNDREALHGDYALWGRMLKQAGVTLLFNRRHYIDVAGGRLALSGLDESKYGRPDPAVVAQPLHDGDLHILLTHSPWALAPLLQGGARVDLALCGHTHGGQIRLPVAAMAAMGYRGSVNRPYFFLSGDHQVGDVRVIVSNGIGCSLLPLRIAAPPQIHVIHFAAG